MSVVYFVRATGIPLVKIGVAADLQKRIAGLQCGCPVPLEVIATFPGGEKEERRVHKVLGEYRSSGEWFEESATAAMVKIATRWGLSAAVALAELVREARLADRRAHRLNVRKLLLSITGKKHLPEAHSIFNLLISDPHSLDAAFASYGLELRPLMPALTSILREADELRGAA